jgi:hypothetical protein
MPNTGKAKVHHIDDSRNDEFSIIKLLRGSGSTILDGHAVAVLVLQ